MEWNSDDDPIRLFYCDLGSVRGTCDKQRDPVRYDSVFSHGDVTACHTESMSIMPLCQRRSKIAWQRFAGMGCQFIE